MTAEFCRCVKCGSPMVLERIDQMHERKTAVVHVIRSEWCAGCRRFIGFTSQNDEALAVKVEIVFKDALHDHRCIWAFDCRAFDPDTRTKFEIAA